MQQNHRNCKMVKMSIGRHKAGCASPLASLAQPVFERLAGVYASRGDFFRRNKNSSDKERAESQEVSERSLPLKCSNVRSVSR